MAGKNLTFEEATESWLLRASGMMRRQIWARYQVDPCRVYEVWMGEEHIGSREAAIVAFREQFPARSIDGLFDWHTPSRKVQTASLNQIELFKD